MEYSTAIHFIYYYAHWQGATAAYNERDPPADLGRRQVHTEYLEGYYSYQEFCRTEHYPTEHSQLQRR